MLRFSPPPDSRDRLQRVKGIHEGGLRRKQIIEEIQHASETWGFFEIVNHGISEDVMNNQLKLKGSTTRET